MPGFRPPWNHAAFCVGKALFLTTAYGICPQSPTGTEASPAMFISGGNNLRRLKTCLAAAHNFLPSEEKAGAKFDNLLCTIERPPFRYLIKTHDAYRYARKRYFRTESGCWTQYLDPIELDRHIMLKIWFCADIDSLPSFWKDSFLQLIQVYWADSRNIAI